MQAEFHRLHPLTMIVELVRQLKGLATLIVVFLVMRMGGGSVDRNEFFFALIGLYAVVPVMIRYFTFTFAIHNGQLIIKQGLITKQDRTIPLDRIQNINVHRGVVHRMFGLVDLRIETAAGGQSEASLSALSEDQAKVIRAQLLSSPGAALHEAGAPAPVERARAVFPATPRELIIAGATQNRALAIIAALGSVIYLVQGAQEQATEGLVKYFQGHPAPMVIAGMILALFAVGWVLSIVGTLITYYGFELAFLPDRMRRSYGMFTQVENVVPLRRVQLVRTSETAIQRLFKFCKVYVETAGGFSAKDAQQQQQSTGSSLISPLLKVERFGELSGLVLPATHGSLGSVAWRQVSPKTVIRQARSTLLFSLICAGVGWYWLQAWSLLLIPALLGLGALSGWLRYKTSGWSDGDSVFCARTGVLGRNAYYAPISKIQSISLSQSPIQRRFGVATLTFRTAATSGSAAVEVLDLPAQEAETLAHSLHERSAAESWKNPDGF